MTLVRLAPPRGDRRCRTKRSPLDELHFVHGPLERVGLGLDVEKFSILLVVYIWNKSNVNQSCRRGGRERAHGRVIQLQLRVQGTTDTRYLVG